MKDRAKEENNAKLWNDGNQSWAWKEDVMARRESSDRYMNFEHTSILNAQTISILYWYVIWLTNKKYNALLLNINLSTHGNINTNIQHDQLNSIPFYRCEQQQL